MSASLPAEQQVTQALGKVKPYDTIMIILGIVILALGFWKPKYKQFTFLGVAIAVFGAFLMFGAKYKIPYAP